MTNRRSFLAGTSAAMAAAALGGASNAGAATKTFKATRLIATEEAFAIPEQVEAMRKAASGLWRDTDLDMWRVFLGDRPYSNNLLRQLLDIDAGRIQVMDDSGVDMHLLSLTSPGVQLLDADTATGLATVANDRLAEAIAKHPTRFAGLASFAPQDPARAVKEIERAMTTLKLNGLVVNSHTYGEYLDEPKFFPILEAAAALNAPIYIHPRNPPQQSFEQLFRGASAGLSSVAWGYQLETGLHAMRLIVTGVFDRLPNLKIVLGHMGEGIPYWLYRMDYMYGVARRNGRNPMQRMPSEYVKDNLIITTSGMNAHPVLQYCHSVLGPDNILFAIDYPYQEPNEAVAFMNTTPLPKADVEKIAWKNAERVFRIRSAT